MIIILNLKNFFINFVITSIYILQLELIISFKQSISSV